MGGPLYPPTMISMTLGRSPPCTQRDLHGPPALSLCTPGLPAAPTALGAPQDLRGPREVPPAPNHLHAPRPWGVLCTLPPGLPGVPVSSRPPTGVGLAPRGGDIPGDIGRGAMGVGDTGHRVRLGRD